MKKVEELNQRLDTILEDSSTLESTIPTEQLVYNDKLYTYLNELNEYEKLVKETLNKKIKNVIKEKDSSIPTLEGEIEDLKQILFCESDENKFLRETGLDKILYKISYSKDVDIVNKNIKEFLKKLKSYDINLDENSFDYTYYTMKYMSTFKQNEDSGNFYITMKKYFEEIYWICPNIIKQLVLNFLDILNKNKKNIHKSVMNVRNELIKNNNFENENLHDLFFIKLNDIYNKKNKDTFYLYDYFTNNSDVLNKMTSFKYDDIIKKYSSKELVTETDEELFINNISSLHSNLSEYVSLMKFKYVIDYENDVLNNKTGHEKISARELAKLLRKKNSYNKKIIKLNIKKDKNRVIGKIDESLDKKIRVNNAYLTSIIDEIYRLNIKDFIGKFNDEITTRLNGNSNIEEALYVASNNYLALSNIIYEKNMDVDICAEIDELENFLLDKNLYISRNTALEFYNNISSLINKKYVLCNINIDIDYTDFSVLSNVIDELYYLMINYNLKQKNLNVKDIEICVRRAED